jgi:eukaryotic-like serine/threonine-protein kinase
MAQIPNITKEQVAEAVPVARNVRFHASGGQKSVFSCTIEGQPYVLKFMLLATQDAQITDDPNLSVDRTYEVFARAKREVETMAQCDSPTLVKLGPIGLEKAQIAGQEVLYFSEELIPGQDLRAIIRDERMLPVDQLVSLATDVTQAVETIWSFAKIHRDIKPGNIIRRDNQSRFVLLDVGLAFDLTDDSITATGILVGTPPYFSPEQMEFTKKRQLDFRSDLFSLGIVLYETATGRHPFRPPASSTMEIMGNILGMRPAPLRDLRPELPTVFESIVLRLLAKRPHLRYRTCDQLLSALRSVPR